MQGYLPKLPPSHHEHQPYLYDNHLYGFMWGKSLWFQVIFRAFSAVFSLIYTLYLTFYGFLLSRCYPKANCLSLHIFYCLSSNCELLRIYCELYVQRICQCRIMFVSIHFNYPDFQQMAKLFINSSSCFTYHLR